MKHAPTWVLSLLDPNPFGDNIQLGFSWIYEALDSGCSGTKCVEIASSALKLLGKRFYSWSSYTGEECLDSFPLTKALSPKFPRHIQDMSPSASIGLSRLLQFLRKTPLLVFTSKFQPTYPLQSRCLALKIKIFRTSVSGWSRRWRMSQIKTVATFSKQLGDLSVGGLPLDAYSTERQAHGRILSTPTTIIAVTRRLEELQYPNTTDH